MAIGLGLLRLSSHDFWTMTPREFAAALRGAKGEFVALAPLDAGALSDLMMLFPDESGDDNG